MPYKRGALTGGGSYGAHNCIHLQGGGVGVNGAITVLMGLGLTVRLQCSWGWG